MTSTALLVVDSLQELVFEGPLPIEPQNGAIALPPEEMRKNLLKWEAEFVDAQAEATIKAVRADWQIYVGWCGRAGRPGLPVSTEDLLEFLKDMVVIGRKRSTINRYLYSIREVNKAAGAPDPTGHKSWKNKWKALVKRLANAKRNAPRQAQPLKQRHVVEVLKQLGDTPRDLRDAALISLASDTLCRESELAAVSLDMFELDDEGVWTLKLGIIKNDQEGLGSSRFVSPATKARIDRWCSTAKITSGYVFLPLGGRPKKAPENPEAPPPSHLRPREVATILRRRAQQAGIKHAERISGHSARVGSTIDMLEGGFSTKEAQYAGGWQTERMVMQYGKQARAGRNAMAQLRARQQGGEAQGVDGE